MPSTKEVSLKESTRARALWSKDNKPNGETGETSFRVYYGATGAAVPFMWESCPGTPKHPMFNKSLDGNDIVVPPLTPPPSYTTTSLTNLTIGHIHSKRRKSKSRIFDVILSSFSRKNSDVTPTSSASSPLSWSNSSSSSSSSISSPRIGGRKNNNNSHRRSISFCSFGAKSSLFGEEVDDNIDMKSLNSAMCFGFKKNLSMQDMKNAIFSIKGH